MVGAGGFEPPCTGLEDRGLNPLGHTPISIRRDFPETTVRQAGGHFSMNPVATQSNYAFYVFFSTGRSNDDNRVIYATVERGVEQPLRPQPFPYTVSIERPYNKLHRFGVPCRIQTGDLPLRRRALYSLS